MPLAFSPADDNEAARYDAFIDAFGTHFASTVYYGGMGVLDSKTSSTEDSLSEDKRREISAKVEGQLKALSASGGYDRSSSSGLSRTDAASRAMETFYWVGGSSVGTSREEWTLSLDGVVPIHVQLRPLDELLSPFFFEEDRITVTVRQKLQARLQERQDLFEEIAKLNGAEDPAVAAQSHQAGLSVSRPIPDR